MIVGSADLQEISERLIPYPNAMADLQEITQRLMIQSGDERECFHLHCTIIGETLQQHMAILGVEKLRVEDVQRAVFRQTLSRKMKNWVLAVKLVIRSLHSIEKDLCDHIFRGSHLVKELKEDCFLETAKDCVMQLLYFGEVVAIGARSGEILFRILGMYDALARCLPDLQTLFSCENVDDDMVCGEAKKVLGMLGEAAIRIVVELEKELQGHTSDKPIKNGGIHPLTRYVMNSVKLLVDYAETFNSVLENAEVESATGERGDTDLFDVEGVSPFTKIVLALVASLESNIEKKSQMYEDVGMQNIFLMNNMLYMLEMVGNSEVRNLLGENWT